MTRKIQINKKYRHFKNKDYLVLNIALDCETLKEVVVYQALYDNKIWVRDYEVFASKVDKEKYPDVDAEYRFTEID